MSNVRKETLPADLKVIKPNTTHREISPVGISLGFLNTRNESTALKGWRDGGSPVKVRLY